MFGGTLSSSATTSLFNGTMAGGNTAQTIAMSEELERTKQELQDQVQQTNHYRDELLKLQRRLVYAEHEAREATTALASASRAAHDDFVANSRTIQDLQAQVDDLTASSMPSHAYAAVMLQIERSVPALLVEVMNHILRRSSADVSTDASAGDNSVALAVPHAALEAVRVLQPVAALGQLRLWIRKLIELDRESLQAANKGKTRSAEATRLLRAISFARPSGDGERSAADSFDERSQGFASFRKKRSSLSAALVSESEARSSADTELIEMLRTRNLELEREIEAMKAFVRDAERTNADVKAGAQALVDAAKKNVATLRLQLREQKRELDAMRSNGHLVPRAELTTAKAEISELKSKLDETVKNAISTLAAKTVESAARDRERNEQVAELERKCRRSEKLEATARELREELAAATASAQSAKQELARANLKTLIEEKHRSESRYQKQREAAETFRRDLEHTKTSLRALQETNRRMIDQYNDLFEAKLAEARLRAKEARAKDHKVATTAVVGPNSEINAQYYQVRYHEALAEFKKAQKKLKHLIFLSHHDHLSFHLQREDLSRQLREVKSITHQQKASEDSDYDNDDGDIIAVLAHGRPQSSATYRSSRTGRSASPSPREGRTSPSDDAGSETDAYFDRVMRNDTSFTAYLERQRAQSPNQGRTTIGRSRPTSGCVTRTASPYTGKNAYDVISPERSVHSEQFPIVGMHDVEASGVAGSVSNPLSASVSATIVTTVTKPSGKDMETSVRSALPVSHVPSVFAKSAPAATGSSTSSPSQARDNSPSQEPQNIAVAEDLRFVASTAGAHRFNVKKTSKPIAYLRKSRASQPVASLAHISPTKSMTPVPRPASAQL